MTNAELINYLKKLPLDMVVVVVDVEDLRGNRDPLRPKVVKEYPSTPEVIVL